MEKRLLDSQKQDEPLNENEPKDLCDILGEFPPNTLKSLQELLLLNEKEIPSRPYSIFQEEVLFFFFFFVLSSFLKTVFKKSFRFLKRKRKRILASIVFINK